MIVSNCLVTWKIRSTNNISKFRDKDTQSFREFKCSSTLLIYVEAIPYRRLTGRLRQEISPLQVSGEKPMRIISLDFCADNYVLKLADPDQGTAISPDAEKDFSHMRNAAAGFRTVRPVSENILILKPDLVVRSYGGGPNAAAFSNGQAFGATGRMGFKHR